ncbi:DUF1150 family protein [Shimia sp. R9_1]|uniref:DUF1150 family protein n=1 Tax=unclassified Shimia TaxID=2630038 RepID=UPI001ADC456F|nr:MULTISPECIES: DUF1150 family protein [unclassified Shimia]MBO9398026.1 DUF1150 family protein [Shimia sp. R9_2]MBO9401078.1 DUF1150 family protein [Shimia sp. R9_3]MBO9406921.1 DUF1150 family protein [Shimia sp. R9_1]
MQAEFDTQSLDDRVVYVREVLVAELPEEVQEQAEGAETLFAVHTTDGERLALVKERNLAFILARQHNYSPVTVH